MKGQSKVFAICGDLWYDVSNHEPTERDTVVVTTHYRIHRTGEMIRIALVADLHDRKYTKLLREIKKASPDMIAIAGDLMNENDNGVTIPDEQQYALDFLADAVKIAPTFYSFGNHERVVNKPKTWAAVKKSGIVMLDNAYIAWHGIWIGGMSSADTPYPHNRNELTVHRVPDLTWLKEFNALNGFKILLCHHPEYYSRYLSHTSIDLILSGHAHGGQWRIFGRGFYAPGQGFFPKLTSGVHDGRLVISRGLANMVKLPRILNPKELVIVDVGIK